MTTSVLYITIQVHKSNRLGQRNAIRQQVEALNWISSPRGAYDRRFTPKDLPQHGVTRPTQPTTKDMLKDRWNQEVQKLARKAQESQWEDVREGAVEGWNAAMRFVKRE